MPGPCMSLYSVTGWQPETREEKREREERDTGSPSEENLSERQGREGLRGAAGQMDRWGTELGFSESIMQRSITFPAMWLRSLG